MPDKKTIDISTGIIFRTIIILLALWFLYLIRDILAILFISLVIVSAIEPTVNWLHKRRIPRPLGVVLVYVLVFCIIGLSVSFLIPPMIEQFKDLYLNVPNDIQELETYLQGFKDYFQIQGKIFDFQRLIGGLGENFTEIYGNIFSKTIDVFSGIISVFVVLVLVFYMAVRQDGIRNFVASIIPERHKNYAISLTERIKDKIGKWMIGQLLLMLIIFLLDFTGLYFIGVPYALSLAFFAGIMEIIPFMGPVIAAIPAAIVGFTVSPITGIIVMLLFFATQQFENHIIVPQVMKKALGLNPIVVILALLVGLKLGGVLGAILAMPITTAIGVVVDDLMSKPKEISA